MDIKRAKEIIESPSVIGVHYREIPVWLQAINQEAQTVKVKGLPNDEIMEVPVAALFEDDLAEYQE